MPPKKFKYLRDVAGIVPLVTRTRPSMQQLRTEFKWHVKQILSTDDGEESDMSIGRPIAKILTHDFECTGSSRTTLAHILAALKYVSAWNSRVTKPPCSFPQMREFHIPSVAVVDSAQCASSTKSTATVPTRSRI